MRRSAKKSWHRFCHWQILYDLLLSSTWDYVIEDGLQISAFRQNNISSTRRKTTRRKTANGTLSQCFGLSFFNGQRGLASTFKMSNCKFPFPIINPSRCFEWESRGRVERELYSLLDAACTYQNRCTEPESYCITHWILSLCLPGSFGEFHRFSAFCTIVEKKRIRFSFSL